MGEITKCMGCNKDVTEGGIIWDEGIVCYECMIRESLY